MSSIYVLEIKPCLRYHLQIWFPIWLVLFSFFKKILIFLGRGGGKEKERERSNHI